MNTRLQLFYASTRIYGFIGYVGAWTILQAAITGIQKRQCRAEMQNCGVMEFPVSNAVPCKKKISTICLICASKTYS